MLNGIENKLLGQASPSPSAVTRGRPPADYFCIRCNTMHEESNNCKILQSAFVLQSYTNVRAGYCLADEE